MGNEFFPRIHFKPGNGVHIRFWKDKWLNNTSLMVEYPSLYQIDVHQNSSIAQNRYGSNWDVHFRRAVQDWEIDSLFDMLAKVEGYNTDVSQPDTICRGNKGTFTSQNQMIDALLDPGS